MSNFKKTRGFNLKSGNKPKMSSFNMMGSTAPSPITSPNKKAEDETSASSDADAITEGAPKVNKFKTAASKLGNTLVGAFTGGLDAVYGTGKVMGANNVVFSKPKKEKEEEDATEFGEVKKS